MPGGAGTPGNLAMDCCTSGPPVSEGTDVGGLFREFPVW